MSLPLNKDVDAEEEASTNPSALEGEKGETGPGKTSHNYFTLLKIKLGT